jgi:hypothetical protein
MNKTNRKSHVLHMLSLIAFLFGMQTLAEENPPLDLEMTDPTFSLALTHWNLTTYEEKERLALSWKRLNQLMSGLEAPLQIYFRAKMGLSSDQLATAEKSLQKIEGFFEKLDLAHTFDEIEKFRDEMNRVRILYDDRWFAFKVALPPPAYGRHRLSSLQTFLSPTVEEGSLELSEMRVLLAGPDQIVLMVNDDERYRISAELEFILTRFPRELFLWTEAVDSLRILRVLSFLQSRGDDVAPIVEMFRRYNEKILAGLSGLSPENVELFSKHYAHFALVTQPEQEQLITARLMASEWAPTLKGQLLFQTRNFVQACMGCSRVASNIFLLMYDIAKANLVFFRRVPLLYIVYNSIGIGISAVVFFTKPQGTSLNALIPMIAVSAIPAIGLALLPTLIMPDEILLKNIRLLRPRDRSADIQASDLTYKARRSIVRKFKKQMGCPLSLALLIQKF